MKKILNFFKNLITKIKNRKTKRYHNNLIFLIERFGDIATGCALAGKTKVVDKTLIELNIIKSHLIEKNKHRYIPLINNQVRRIQRAVEIFENSAPPIDVTRN